VDDNQTFSAPAVQSVTEATVSASVSTAVNENNAVRAIAYLSPEEAQQFEMLWLQMRGLGIRPSKADIMRAALLVAIDNPKLLEAKFTGQQPAAPATGGRPATTR